MMWPTKVGRSTTAPRKRRPVIVEAQPPDLSLQAMASGTNVSIVPMIRGTISEGEIYAPSPNADIDAYLKLAPR